MPRVGFFSLGGLYSDFRSVDFALMNIGKPERLRDNLALARGIGLTVNIDVGVKIVRMRDPEKLATSRTRADGTLYTKKFPPLSKVKALDLESDDEIADALSPFVPTLLAYQDVIGAFFLPDEPYLNGIPRAELERAAGTVRRVLTAAGMKNVRIGVNFAAAMFNRDFAAFIQDEAWRHCEKADAWHAELEAEGGPALGKWTERFSSRRLTTYDMAGNMYEGGGIPEGVDLVSFDFYLSSLLNDRLFDNVPAWLVERYPSEASAPFSGRSVTEIKRDMGKDADADRLLLDRLFECRNATVIELLRLEAAKLTRPLQLMFLSRAGENNEPCEARILDEVRRAISLSRREDIDLMFFLFQDAFDSSINLRVGGVSDMPRVLEEIYAAAAKQAVKPVSVAAPAF